MSSPPPPTTVSTAAKAVIKSTAKAPATSSKPNKRPPLFHFHFTPNPGPINNTLYTSTRQIASDPSHPYYIRTQRRLAAFDASKLHWTVKAPVELSKKAIVRNWAVRRVKAGFRAELKVRGWGKDGSRLLAKESGGEGEVGLKGALCVWLGKDAGVVTAGWEEVRKECAGLVRKVEELQRGNNGKVGARTNGWKDAVLRTAATPAPPP